METFSTNQWGLSCCGLYLQAITQGKRHNKVTHRLDVLNHLTTNIYIHKQLSYYRVNNVLRLNRSSGSLDASYAALSILNTSLKLFYLSFISLVPSSVSSLQTHLFFVLVLHLGVRVEVFRRHCLSAVGQQLASLPHNTIAWTNQETFDNPAPNPDFLNTTAPQQRWRNEMRRHYMRQGMFTVDKYFSQ